MTWLSEARPVHQRPLLTQPSFSGTWVRQTPHGAYPWPLPPITWLGNLLRSTLGSGGLGKDYHILLSWWRSAKTGCHDYKPGFHWAHIFVFLTQAYNKSLEFPFPPKTALRWMTCMASGPDGLVFHSSSLNPSNWTVISSRYIYNCADPFILACDWSHGVPQLFYQYSYTKYTLPDSCAVVALFPEYI